MVLQLFQSKNQEKRKSVTAKKTALPLKTRAREKARLEFCAVAERRKKAGLGVAGSNESEAFYLTHVILTVTATFELPTLNCVLDSGTLTKP